MPFNELYASAIQVDITPPIGTPLEGYGARDGVSTGVHDPLLAQLLLLKSGSQQVAIICMDLLGVSLDFTRRVRDRMVETIGIHESGILVACSHTHAGPAGFLSDTPGLSPSHDPELQMMVLEKLTDAAIRAENQLQPARMGVGRGDVEGIGRNRNDPESGPIDDEVIVLRIDSLDGAPIAVLMNYGSHPTVLGYQNLLVSADFPGAARAALQMHLPDTIFLYSNGASGDVSTRFTRRDQSFAEVERMGKILAGEVLKAMEAIITERVVELNSHIQPITLRYRTFPDTQEAASSLREFEADLDSLKASGASHGEIRQAITRVEGATIQILLAKTLADRSQKNSEMQVLKIGPLSVLGMPGEPFVRIVQDIKSRSPSDFTAVISYANDEAGYFPDTEAFSLGTYEALSSPYEDDIAEMLSTTGLALLGSI